LIRYCYILSIFLWDLLHLDGIVVDALTGFDTENRVIMNPATVEGRQAIHLARDLPHFEIIGTDIDPRWEAARDLADSETFLQVARNAVDSDICISIIDLDRAIYLQEQGYDVMYREEVFFAHRRVKAVVDSERPDQSKFGGIS
jgi:hypothetical protein